MGIALGSDFLDGRGDKGEASDFAGFAVLEKFEFVWDRPVMTLPGLSVTMASTWTRLTVTRMKGGVRIWRLLGDSGEGQDDCQ